LKGKIVPRLNKAPNKAQTINMFDGENLSEMVNNAKINVPITNPNCTAEVKCAKAF